MGVHHAPEYANDAVAKITALDLLIKKHTNFTGSGGSSGDLYTDGVNIIQTTNSSGVSISYSPNHWK